ncbi:NAD dependent epimerase/dehydratase [Bimuria novae-zelandiae CBS 107.79]|uniref:NAD dependent epimerase/dehydratase n=1 Tax=Bimuria novae-zelandiae CBS 107.79 TaxID=1447943 RepID=A0A6A5UKZ2_9PLEO|nr:NAD dependent epimerase/dehydratase [Bimuria novae-zelandiae CBS 107.79]
MAKTIFITGGSGYIGSVIVEYAVAQGYSVNALSRSESNDTKLRTLGANPVRGDIKSLDLLTNEASKADVVISIADSLAGNFDISQDERWAINFAAHDALVEGIKGTNKPLLITSGALNAMPRPDDEETDETSPGWPEGHPFSRGFESNNKRYTDQGIRVCYVRLAPYVYGRGGSGVKLFMDMWGPKGAGGFVKPGTALSTTVHVEDAARLYLLIAEKGKGGEIYNATSETSVAQKSIAEAICKTLRIPCKELELEDAKALMGDFLAMFLTLKCRAVSKKAMEELGWSIQAERGILEEIESGSYADLEKQSKVSTFESKSHDGFVKQAAGGA